MLSTEPGAGHYASGGSTEQSGRFAYRICE